MIKLSNYKSSMKIINNILQLNFKKIPKLKIKNEEK